MNESQIPLKASACLQGLLRNHKWNINRNQGKFYLDNVCLLLTFLTFVKHCTLKTPRVHCLV